MVLGIRVVAVSGVGIQERAFMRIPRRSIRKAAFALLGLALFTVAVPSFADDDPPGRVARLSFMRGDVSFAPAGDDDWVQASINRPLGTGDKLYTDNGGRVELEIGAATLRLDQQTSFDVLNLDDTFAQTELTSGTMNLHVRRVFEGQSYEVDTPTLAFVVTQPGDFRVDIAPDGSSTMITVFNGTGDVYGEDNASYSVREGQSYRFHDSALQDYEVSDIPRGDEFDGWVDSRNQRYESAVSRQYVDDDVIGYADLDDYGGWDNTPDYGQVWYPTQVAADWAPYRSGHWAWIDPWGWSWVDNAAWGFAPFHYGRWVNTGNRWGWCPGPRHVRAIYAPALVAFVGGGGFGINVGSGPVGWFPLGPRDVYVPWYHASRGYFTNVNVRNTTIINNTYITNVYNDYSRGRPITGVNYAYRNDRALTAVSRETFVGARPVNAGRVQIDAAQLRGASVVSRVGIAPDRSSFVSANAARARAVPTAQTLDRRVIARTAPPPRPAPVATRLAAIQRNNAQPLPTAQLRQISTRAPVAGTAAPNRAAAQRVQVVGQGAAAKPRPIPTRAPGAVANGRPTVTPNNPATPNGRTPVVPRGQTGTTPANDTPAGRGMPSSRFSPNGQNHANPAITPNGTRPNPAGPANGRAPVTTTPRTVTPTTPNNERVIGNTRTPVTPRTTTPPVNATPNNGRAISNERTVTPRTTTPRAPTESVSRPPSNNPQFERRATPPVQSNAPQNNAPSRTIQRREPTPQPQQNTQREFTPRTSSPPVQPRVINNPPPVPRAPVVQQPRQAPQPAERRAPPSRDKDDRKKDDGGH
jgi:hypothetical protein